MHADINERLLSRAGLRCRFRGARGNDAIFPLPRRDLDDLVQPSGGALRRSVGGLVAIQTCVISKSTLPRVHSLLSRALLGSLKGVVRITVLKLVKLWSLVGDHATGAAHSRFWARGRTHDREIAVRNGQSCAPKRTAFGAIEVPAEKYWGAQSQRSLKQFQDRLGKAAEVDRARARHRQARCGRGQYGARQTRCEPRQGHRRRRAGGDRRQAR